MPTLQVFNDVSEEARLVGWHPPVNLFYSWRPSELLIGKVPEEAKIIGFARSVHLPYSHWSERSVSYLMICCDVQDPSYQDAIQIGWDPACDLPYCILPDSDERNLSVLTVSFPLHDLRYEQAIAAGYHPACKLSDFSSLEVFNA